MYAKSCFFSPSSLFLPVRATNPRNLCYFCVVVNIIAMKDFLLKHQLLLAGLLVAMGLGQLGGALRSAIIHMKDSERVISAKGLAERDVPADKVTWPLMYKELGNDPAALCQTIEAKNAIIVKFLKDAGLTDEEITVNPPTINDRQADNYGNEILNYRYRVTSIITVASTNVDKVRQLISRQSDLMRQDIALVHEEYGSNNIRYDFTGLNDIKPEMVEEATRNARATAQKFAEDSDCELGDILSATQGQFSIEDSDPTTPHVKHVRVVTSIEYMVK